MEAGIGEGSWAGSAGCYRFGLVHTTPKSKHAIVLISHRGQLAPVTPTEEFELEYETLEVAGNDLFLDKRDGERRVLFVKPGGMAWNKGVREGMLVLSELGWDGDPDKGPVTVTLEGKRRFWQMAFLQCNVMSTLRIADALARPSSHNPVFWQTLGFQEVRAGSPT